MENYELIMLDIDHSRIAAAADKAIQGEQCFQFLFFVIPVRPRKKQLLSTERL